MPQSRRRILLQFVEKRRLELMSHEKQLVRGFVEQFAIRFDPSSFGVVIILRHFVKGVLQTHHVAGQVLRVWKDEKRLGRDVAAPLERRRGSREMYVQLSYSDAVFSRLL